MKNIIALLFCSVLFGNSARAMHEEDTSASKTPTISKTAGESKTKTERELHDELVEGGDQKAIKRKIEGLTKGEYGYELSLQAAREFNDGLIEGGDLEAIRRKIEGLTEGEYGYELSLQAAREFEEFIRPAAKVDFKGEEKGAEKRD